MKNFSKRLVGRLVSTEGGFTLVELLVVVGVIVALAAAIIPNVVKFAGKGDDGAKAAEISSVQSALDTMMADKRVILVTANVGPANSTNDFAAVPTEGPLTGYLRNNPTVYFYCWNASGLITRQDASATACP